MPHYYFDVDDSWTLRDEEGLDLPDEAAARAEAVRLAGEVIRDHAARFRGEPWRFTVREDSGTVFSISLVESTPG